MRVAPTARRFSENGRLSTRQAERSRRCNGSEGLDVLAVIVRSTAQLRVKFGSFSDEFDARLAINYDHFNINLGQSK